MTPINWAMEPLRKYAVFSGRASRSEYWWFYLAILIASFLAGIVEVIIGTSILSNIFTFAILIPTISVSVRRLHDTGRSGWWMAAPIVALLAIIPFSMMAGAQTEGVGEDSYGVMIVTLIAVILAIVLTVLMILPSHKGGNQYGPNPHTGEQLQAD